jgi:CheY-like chemotaxis protein
MAPGLRVLVVEDNRDAADSLATLLLYWGHQAEVAEDGSVALEKVYRLCPEVVLLDIGLPGMNGWELARQIKTQFPGKEPCLIAISGYGQTEDLERSRAEGIVLHLVKPVEPDALEAVLKECQERLRRAGA